MADVCYSPQTILGVLWGLIHVCRVQIPSSSASLTCRERRNALMWYRMALVAYAFMSVCKAVVLIGSFILEQCCWDRVSRKVVYTEVTCWCTVFSVRVFSVSWWNTSFVISPVRFKRDQKKSCFHGLLAINLPLKHPTDETVHGVGFTYCTFHFCNVCWLLAQATTMWRKPHLWNVCTRQSIWTWMLLVCHQKKNPKICTGR